MPFRTIGTGALLLAFGFLWIGGHATAQHIHAVPQADASDQPMAVHHDSGEPARHGDRPQTQASSFGQRPSFDQPSSFDADATATTSHSSEPSFPSLTRAPSDGDQHSTSAQSPDLSRLGGPALTMASSLAVVLGLFAGLVWLTRRFGSKANGGGELPRDVVQSLGSTSVGPRTRVMLLKCGAKVIVVAQTATEIKPLSEITDPEQVRQLVALCQGDSRAAFSQTLRSIEREPVAAGFVG